LDFKKFKRSEKVEQGNDKKTQKIGADISQIKFNETDFVKRRIQRGYQTQRPFCRASSSVKKMYYA